MDGFPRGGLRAALRRAQAPHVPRDAPVEERLIVQEEEFDPRAGLPEDLFGPGFRWDLEGSEGLAFFDLETCGLADEPIFLVGVLKQRGAVVSLRRALARDASGEPALLRFAAGALGGGATWISFNGRSFDGPRLRRRAIRHGIEFPQPLEHRDLLLEVRRRFKGSLPDCRLGTVERRLLKLERGPFDVPGREVPERYRDYVRTGDPRWIAPVLEHNRRDVAAMAVLLRRLGA
jgi:uncharacterized protein YprB with RNaseH-like and TPR domain